MSYSESERKLTNDDFRKIFMTPRHPDAGRTESMLPPKTPGTGSIKRQIDKEKYEKRKKKKQFYSKIKKEEDDHLAELAERYRDRAKERREGFNPEQQREAELLTSQGAYRAVAPDFRGNFDAAERRKQMIQESKFLGGDMEHTHLVKGLDYALLQKVKSEIDNEEDAEDETAPPETNEINEENEKKEKQAALSATAADVEASCKTKVARNVYRVVFRTSIPQRNELFVPGRMAYVMDLEDECAESDIPTTVIRSKADVPLADGQATLTTNDIVINKLAQILSYLRSGSKAAKKNKKVKDIKTVSVEKQEKEHSHSSSRKLEDDSIYGDIGDYVPFVEKTSKHRDRGRVTERDNHDRGRDGARERGREKDRDRERDKRRAEKERSSKRAPYFEKPEEDVGVVLDDANNVVDQARKRDREAWIDADGTQPSGGDMTFGSILKKDDKSLSKTQKLLSKINSQPEGYAECYPGFDEMHDALDDSDEETDYSKMDPGKKKGTVGRWDFDSMEEYSDYMSNKEALPKAAFQFGVKMNDGRKTRKVAKTEKQEKQQLDKQWQQIQSIIEKRKAAGGGDGESVPKTPRM